MADSLEEGDYRKEAYYGTFQSGLPQPVPPSQGPHYSGQYPSVTGLFLLLLLAGSCCHKDLNMLSFVCGATHWMLLTLRKQSSVCCRFLSLKPTLFGQIPLCLFVYFVWVSSVQSVQDNGLCDNSPYKRGIQELNFG
jgi:hypothetical protein